MATARDIVSRALRLIGALAAGEAAAPEDAADGLTALNSMLDSWQIKRLYVYQILQRNLPWPQGAASRTIGPGADFDVPRPTKIDSAYVRYLGTQDYPVEVLTERTSFDNIVQKGSTATLPSYLYCDSANPVSTLHLWGVPSVPLVLLLNVWQTLQQFASINDDLILPPGYRRAIEYSLAEDLAPEYGAAIPAAVKETAVESRRAISAVNAPTIIASTEAGMLKPRSRSYNIENDTGY